MNLIKWFLSSNAALNELQNEHLIKVFNEANLDMPSMNSFTEVILPNVLRQVKGLIEEKLRLACVIILITDIWSSSQMADFLALSVMICYDNFEKECYTIGLKRMPGSHNAENVKITIELIINEYDFDKTKIKGSFNKDLNFLYFNYLSKYFF